MPDHTLCLELPEATACNLGNYRDFMPPSRKAAVTRERFGSTPALRLIRQLSGTSSSSTRHRARMLSGASGIAKVKATNSRRSRGMRTIDQLSKHYKRAALAASTRTSRKLGKSGPPMSAQANPPPDAGKPRVQHSGAFAGRRSVPPIPLRTGELNSISCPERGTQGRPAATMAVNQLPHALLRACSAIRRPPIPRGVRIGYLRGGDAVRPERRSELRLAQEKGNLGQRWIARGLQPAEVIEQARGRE